MTTASKFVGPRAGPWCSQDLTLPQDPCWCTWGNFCGEMPTRLWATALQALMLVANARSLPSILLSWELSG